MARPMANLLTFDYFLRMSLFMRETSVVSVEELVAQLYTVVARVREIPGILATAQ